MAKRGAPKKTAETIPATVVNPETNQASILTEELISKIENLYRFGVQDNTIANIVGVNVKTMRDWLHRGAQFNYGLHGELFRRCAKAVGSCEVEWLSEMKKHAMGTPKEFAYNIGADGSKTIALDGDGQPIVLKEEVRGNPIWISWFLERRFKKTFAKQERFELVTSTPDEGFYNAQNNQDEKPKEGTSIKNLSEEMQVKLLEAALKQKKATGGL